MNFIRTSLGEEFKVIMGQSPPSTSYNSDKKGLPFFQGKKEFTDLHPSPEVWCTKTTKIAEGGDVLLSIRAPIGPVNIASEKCGIGRGLAAIRPNARSSTKLIFYLLQSKEQELAKKGTGTTFNAITKPNLLSIPIAIPETKKEQDLLVAEIEKQLTRLETSTRSLKSIKSKLEIYRKSVLKAAFYKKDEWDEKEFGTCVNNFDGKRVPLSKIIRANRKGKFPYYGATEIVDYINDYIFDGEYLLIGEDGANLLSRSKPLSFVAHGKFWVNNHAHVVQTKEFLLLKYLNYFFNSLTINQFVSGTAQPKLNQANMNKIKITFPISLLEQQAIIQKIESRFSVMDKMAAIITLNLQNLERLKKSILKSAFEGKLVKE